MCEDNILDPPYTACLKIKTKTGETFHWIPISGEYVSADKTTYLS